MKVAILMGSQSDREVMQPAADRLKELRVGYEWSVISAHRAPEELHNYIKDAESRGITVFIAGAGGAAHLPGVVASFTTRPVIGVPVHTSKLNGLDSLLSIVNMPKGVPVATMAIGPAGAANAGVFAASLIGLANESVAQRVKELRESSKKKLVEESQTTREIYEP